jgi:hypothetical protein
LHRLVAVVGLVRLLVDVVVVVVVVVVDKGSAVGANIVVTSVVVMNVVVKNDVFPAAVSLSTSHVLISVLAMHPTSVALIDEIDVDR